ncbi:MAG: phage holin family protein [Synechococcales cyanobacterium RM1_1_8]|nr:phage holin family protein [Synechococcales cyanobacterium RM1_1_8]
MQAIIGFVVVAIVTAIALIILSKIPPLGIEIDGLDKAITAGIIFGVLNGLAGIVKGLLSLGPLEFIFFPVIILINIFVFGLTAKLVQGFRLKSIWSAVLGAFLLGILNSILLKLLAGLTGVAA